MIKLRVVAVAAVATAAFSTPAAASTGGAPVHGSFVGTGSSTLDLTAGAPIVRSTSSGQLKGSVLGPGRYVLEVGGTPLVQGVTLTITAKNGSLEADALLTMQ